MYQIVEYIKFYHNGQSMDGIFRMIVALNIIDMFPRNLQQVFYQVLINYLRSTPFPDKYNGFTMPLLSELMNKITRDEGFLPLYFQKLLFQIDEGYDFDAYDTIKSIDKLAKVDNYLFNANFYLIAFKLLDQRYTNAEVWYKKYKEIIDDQSLVIPKRRKIILIGNEAMHYMK